MLQRLFSFNNLSFKCLIVFLLIFLLALFEIETKDQGQQSLTSNLKTTSPEYCSRIFTAPLTLNLERRTKIKGPQLYSNTSTSSERFTLPDGRTGQYVLKRFPTILNTSSQSTLVGQLVIDSSPSPFQSISHDQGLQSFKKLISRAMEAVIEDYKIRRPHWTDSFLESLKALAFELIEESSYIVVQDGTLREEAPIRGTVRLIKEKNGLLPVEKKLGIKVLVDDNKMKIEPGNLHVDKDFSMESWAELVIHMISANVNHHPDERESHFITYADKQSRILYRQLGFKPIDRSRLELKEGTELNNKGQILYEDVLWTPMEASLEEMNGVLDKYLSKLKNRGLEEEALSALHRLQESNQQPTDNFQNKFIGKEISSHQDNIASLTIDHESTNLNIKLSTSKNAFFHIAQLKKELLPLEEGIDNLLISRDTYISYKNNILTIKSTDLVNKTIIIETNPRLSSFGKVHIEIDNNITSIFQF